MSKVNIHMTHVEDTILDGIDNAKWAIEHLLGLYSNLAGFGGKFNQTLSIKIDGSPAVFAWSKFPGLVGPGIAIKGLFNKDPKYMVNEKEIEVEYGDKPELVKKLTAVLKAVRKIGIPEGQIWQGDYLFDSSTLFLDKTNFKGRRHFYFHPNTIRYYGDLDEVYGKQVGICWHTRYTAPNLTEVKTTYDVRVEELENPDACYNMDPYIDDLHVEFSPEDIETIQNTLRVVLNLVEDDLATMSFYDLIENKDIIDNFRIFQNTCVREDNYSYFTPTHFKKFLTDRFFQKDLKLKSDKGKEKNRETLIKILSFLSVNSNMISNVFQTIRLMNSAKLFLLKKLNAAFGLETYLVKKDGTLIATQHEGFALSDSEGNVVKLVDRYAFSRANFSDEYIKGWE
ncbi:MAG: DUF6267 family protein [Candidatus Thorarchaeota archaeon]